MKRNRPIHLPDGYEISVPQSITEVEEIRCTWEQMQSCEIYPVIMQILTDSFL